MDWKIQLAGFVLGCFIQAGSFAYFFGRLSQSVRDLGSRVERIEEIFDSTNKAALSKAVGR